MESKLVFDFKTNQQIIKKIAFIDSFKGKWTGLEVKESIYLKELKQIATIESIGSSTRIEGSTLTDREVKQLIDSVKITSFKTRDEQEVFGYYDVLNLILESYDSIEIKENHIHHLHKSLLQVSSKDESHRGRYKKLSNKVVANYPGGKQKIIFNTTEPFLVKGEMENLISWTNENIQKEELHPLLIISVFVYEFLSRKKEYYKALMSGQKDRGTKEEIINEWILFFLGMLEATINKLEDRYAKIRNKKSYLNDRQKEVLQFIQNNEPVKISDVTSSLKEYTSYTLKKDIKYLTEEGVIKKLGKARATIYVMNELKK